MQGTRVAQRSRLEKRFGPAVTGVEAVGALALAGEDSAELSLNATAGDHAPTDASTVSAVGHRGRLATNNKPSCGEGQQTTTKDISDDYRWCKPR